MGLRFLCPILTVCLALVAGLARGGPLPRGAVARLGSGGIQPSGPVTFAPDGKVLAVSTSSPTRKVRFWDTTTGALVRSFDLGEVVGFFGLVSTTEGTCFAVGDAAEIRFLDVRSGKVVRRFKGPGRFLDCLALSPNGKLLAATKGLRGTVFEPHEIVLWDLARGKELVRLDGHKTWVSVLAFSADGKRLLSSSEDYERTRFPTIQGSVCVWEVAGGKLLRQLRQRGQYVSFSPDGRIAACRGKDWRVLVWDLEKDRERARLPEKWMYPIFLPDGKTMTLGGNKEMLGLWNLDGKRVRSFQGILGGGASPVGVSADGKLLATIGASRIRLWDVAKGKERRFGSGHESGVPCLAFAAGSKVMVSGGKDMTVRVWDVPSGKELLVYDKHRAAITAVVCSPDGKTVASGDAANAVHLWDRSTGALRHRLVLNSTPPADGDRTGITSLVFSADGKTLFAASSTFHSVLELWGKTVCVDLATGKVVQTVRETGSGPDAIAPDGRTVASISLGLTKMLKIESKLLLRNPYSGSVMSCVDCAFNRAAFSSDGKTLAIRGGSQGFGVLGGTGEYRCWLLEVATGEEIVPLGGGTGMAVFAPRATLLVAIGEGEKDVLLLSTITGKVVGKLSGHTEEVKCCAFSPDGTRLATGSADGSILVWDATQFPAPALPKVTDLQPRDLEKLWSDLAGSNAPVAYRATWTLVAVPAKSLPLLRDRLKPASGASAAVIERHIKALDSKSFRKREQAAAELEKLGEQAIPALRRLLLADTTLELRRRVERLLARLERPLTAEQLRLVRAVTVLERIGTAEAVRTLQALARGAPGALLTEEARAALERLKRLR